jgi:hypothetical protein
VASHVFVSASASLCVVSAFELCSSFKHTRCPSSAAMLGFVRTANSYAARFKRALGAGTQAGPDVSVPSRNRVASSPFQCCALSLHLTAGLPCSCGMCPAAAGPGTVGRACLQYLLRSFSTAARAGATCCLGPPCFCATETAVQRILRSSCIDPRHVEKRYLCAASGSIGLQSLPYSVLAHVMNLVGSTPTTYTRVACVSRDLRSFVSSEQLTWRAWCAKFRIASVTELPASDVRALGAIVCTCGGHHLEGSDTASMHVDWMKFFLKRSRACTLLEQARVKYRLRRNQCIGGVVATRKRTRQQSSSAVPVSCPTCSCDVVCAASALADHLEEHGLSRARATAWAVSSERG